MLKISESGDICSIFFTFVVTGCNGSPAPVSALFYAATMVTAGVYSVARCSPVFEYSLFSSKGITIVGASAAFYQYGWF